MGSSAPIERQAAQVIADDVARNGHDDTRERKGLPPPIGCLPLIGLLVLVSFAGLAIGYWGFNPNPAPTAAPTSSPTAPPSATPTSSATATASPSRSPSPVPLVTPAPTVTASPSPAGPSGQIDWYCIRVEHSNFGQFLSYLEWMLGWSGDQPLFFEVLVSQANDGEPARLDFDPGQQQWYGRSGLNSTGTKTILSLIAYWADGTTTNLTEEMIDAFGGDEIEVRQPPQEDEYGPCPQDL